MSWEDEVRLKVIDKKTGKRFDVSPKAFKDLYLVHGNRIQLDGTEGANADYAWVGYGKSTPSDTGGERYGQDPIELPEYHTQPFSRDPSTFKESNMNSLLNASRGDLLRSGTFSRDPSTFKESNMNSLLNASRGDLLRSGTFSRDPSTFKESNMNSLLNAARGDILKSGTFSRDPSTFKKNYSHPTGGSVNSLKHFADIERRSGVGTDDWGNPLPTDDWGKNRFETLRDREIARLNDLQFYSGNGKENSVPTQTEQTQNYTPWQSFWDIGSSAKDALSEGYNLFRDNVQDYRQDRSFSPQNFFSDTFQGISDAYNEPYTPIEALTYDSMADTASGIWSDLTGWLSGDDEIKAAEAEKAELDKYLKDAEYRYVNIHGAAWDEAAIKEVIAQFHRDKRYDER